MNYSDWPGNSAAGSRSGRSSCTEEEVAAQAMTARSKLDDLVPRSTSRSASCETSIDDPLTYPWSDA